LLACIGLERLLVLSNSKHREQLLKGVYLFSGRNDADRSDSVEKQFDNAYDKRCDFVHKGEAGSITLTDARIVQEILFNVVLNISTHLKPFNSKGAVADTARKIDAARRLDIESRYWPRNMLYWHCTTQKLEN